MIQTIVFSVLYSVAAHVLCHRLIHSTKDMFVKARMFGRDLNKTSDDKV